MRDKLGRFLAQPKEQVNCFVCDKLLFRHLSDTKRRKTFYCEDHKSLGRDDKGRFIKGPNPEMVVNSSKAKIGVSVKHDGQFKKGFKPWNFNTGLTPVQRKIRVITSYKEWRKAVYEKDNYTCQLCNIRGDKLNADHYPKSFSSLIIENNIKNIEEAINCPALWNLENGRTLCVECHKDTKSWGSQQFAVGRSAQPCLHM